MKLLLTLLFFVTAIAQPCSTTAWNGISWTNGPPTVNMIAQIDAPYVVNPFQGFDCCGMVVNAPVEIKGRGYITILNHLTVNSSGSVIVRSSGSLLPVSETFTTTGVVSIQRTTTLQNPQDYTYWGSPVSGATIGSVFSSSSWHLTHIFWFNIINFVDQLIQSGTIFTPGQDGYDDNADTWTHVPAISAMIPGKGYAAMSKVSGYTTATFTGSLNHGVHFIPLQLSGDESTDLDNFNLISNPGAGGLFAPAFITENLSVIDGTLYFWAHKIGPSASNPGNSPLNYHPNNYAVLNLMGGIAAVYGGPPPGEMWGSCQGVMVNAKIAGFAVVKPHMYAPGYSNAGFFRNAIDGKKSVRISMYNPDNTKFFDQQLIGYAPGTSLEYENGWDTRESSELNHLKFYSLQGGEKLQIQSRGEFSAADIVPLGYHASMAGTYTIAVDSLAGIDNVFIRDNGVVHPLPYTLTTAAGQFHNRLDLVYNNSLSIADYERQKISVYPNPATDHVTICGAYEKFILYDILGQKICSGTSRTIDLHRLASGVYILKIDDHVIKLIKK